MGQKLRIDAPGAWHHLTNRGARQYSVFVDDEDRGLFVSLLAEAHQEFGFVVAAYALMQNHWHIVARTEDGSISDAVQWFASKYSKRFNKAHGYDGPLCKARFHPELITSDAQFLAATRYAHRNPLEVGLDIGTYPWSSYPIYGGTEPTPSWIDSRFVTDIAGGLQAYRTFVESDWPSDKAPLSAGTTQWEAQPRVETAHQALERLVEVVGEVTRTSGEALSLSTPGVSNLSRSVAVLIAVESGRFDTPDVAARLGFPSAGAVRTAATRSRRTIESDPTAQELFRHSAELWNL